MRRRCGNSLCLRPSHLVAAPGEAVCTTGLDPDRLGFSRGDVGALVRTAGEKGRAIRLGIKLGVCGEHSGDPHSIHSFEGVGLDYVSSSPFRVPFARVETCRATLAETGSESR